VISDSRSANAHANANSQDKRRNAGATSPGFAMLRKRGRLHRLHGRAKCNCEWNSCGPQRRHAHACVVEHVPSVNVCVCVCVCARALAQPRPETRERFRNASKLSVKALKIFEKRCQLAIIEPTFKQFTSLFSLAIKYAYREAEEKERERSMTH